MAVTATAGKQLAEEGRPFGRATRISRMPLWPRLGVRAQQIALLTLLVALVVIVTTVVNIGYITGGIVNRTEAQAHQLTEQMIYAIQQELTHEVAIDEPNPYAVLAREHSGVRGVMASMIVTKGPIAFLYVTNVSGKIITDKTGKLELAVNRYLIGEVPSNRPELSELTSKRAYIQFLRIFSGEPFYEYRKRLPDEVSSVEGTLHIGISTTAVREQLLPPTITNLIIGLLAILGAAIVAISSANLLLRPLEAISSSIEGLGLDAPPEVKPASLSHEEVVTGVTARIKQLGERLAGERSELEIMRGRLRQVISHLEERLLLINREGRVILASPDAEQILRTDNLELAGLPIHETLGYSHPLVELVERAFAERRSVARTTLHVPGDSRPRQLLASVQYIEDAGEPVGALVSLRDYESFQRFESQWDLSKKLADLGRITSGIAHEVKNPLNAMVIHLEILRSKLESGSGDPTPQIEILDSEIKRLDRVVATFLNFTRPVEVRMQPLDLNKIVSQVVALASTEASERGVSIKRELSEEPLMIKGDSDLLKQALLNIIINGCQAMPEGGPLRVVTQRGADGSATIKVSDRGVGIAPEARDKIFTLYHTTKKGGTGIGLAQAFRAVQLHNGFIRFDTEVGVGTTFEITLPALS
ncbi:MAG TPA: ATP-binding protein [Blastocatellia bacterium]|nr:ATP-binding protein [Blastocatellia bacterium]